MTLLLFLCEFVMQHDSAATGDSRADQDQRAVRIDRQCLRLFFKRRALRVCSTDTYSDLHQYTLTPAARSRVSGTWVAFCHNTPNLQQ